MAPADAAHPAPRRAPASQQAADNRPDAPTFWRVSVDGRDQDRRAAQDLRGHRGRRGDGPRRRLGDDPRHRRRERCRQVDADEGPGRGDPPGRRIDLHRRSSRRAGVGSGGARERDRNRLPGAEHPSRSPAAGQPVRQSGADPLRARRHPGDGATSPPGARPARPRCRSRRSGRVRVDRRATADRAGQSAAAASQCADPRRAQLGAQRPGDPAAVRDPARVGGRGDHRAVRVTSPRGGLPDRRPRDGDARRPGDPDPRHHRPDDPRGGRGDGRDETGRSLLRNARAASTPVERRSLSMG